MQGNQADRFETLKKANLWLYWLITRKGPDTCRICGEGLEKKPGSEFYAPNGIILLHWECWESMPMCGMCGRGNAYQRCFECL